MFRVSVWNPGCDPYSQRGARPGERASGVTARSDVDPGCDCQSPRMTKSIVRVCGDTAPLKALMWAEVLVTELA